MDELAAFPAVGQPTPGHPEVDLDRGIENTSGPLGQGHAMALGAAIAERFLVARFGDWMAHKTYAFISDGGIQEEVSQGVGRIAGHLGLSNLIMFYDSNNTSFRPRSRRFRPRISWPSTRLGAGASSVSTATIPPKSVRLSPARWRRPKSLR